jgi:hypothetical protein
VPENLSKADASALIDRLQAAASGFARSEASSFRCLTQYSCAERLMT